MNRLYHYLQTMALCLLMPATFCIDTQAQWVDITKYYLSNTGFDNGSDQGWTYWFNGGTCNRREGSMEFWNNNSFDIHQDLTGLTNGHYRLSVQSYYRCQDNQQGYNDYKNGTENITAVMYAGSKEQKLLSVYTFAFNQNEWGTWSPDNRSYYPNTMEAARKAFDQGQYWNIMEFDVTDGAISIGLKNNHYIYSNWCIFDNFKLEVSSQSLTPAANITINAASTELIIGESTPLTVNFSPDNTTIKRVTWASNNADVATIDDHGILMAMGQGQAVITATAIDGGGATASVTITVTDNPATAASLVINEIMASNIDLAVSPAFNFDGWIELYNPTDKAVSLKGLYISDDPLTTHKWQMNSRAGVIPAHGFKLVWFDSAELCADNAPFKLDTDGGTLIISNPQGTIIAQQDFPEALERVAYARTTDGGETWALTADATPGRSNATAAFADTQLPAPTTDIQSCLFSNSLTINIGTTEGATVRYTTDGTLPTMNNGTTLNGNTMTISKTTSLRLRQFQDGMLPSKVTTRSYIYKDKDYQLPVISVVADPKFLYDDSIGVMVQGVNGRTGNGQRTPCNWNMDWERPVNMSFIAADGTMTLNQDVNLEMAGGWSRAFTPHSFKLKGNKELGGNKNLNYPFFTAKPFIRNRTLQIRNGGNDTGCRIKDAALQSIIQTSGIDIDLQSYQPIHEFINGKYMGVLNMREPNNKHYVYANYGWDEEDIDQFEMSPDSGYVQKCGNEDAFNRLCELSANAADPVAYNEILQLLDIDEYINYMAMEMYVGNTDWPQNNIKGFRHINGKFRFVSFDLDHAFNTANSFSTFDSKKIYTFDEIYDTGLRETEEIKMVTIFDNLLLNDDFKSRFIDAFTIMGGSVFEKQRADAVIDSLVNKVNPMMALEGGSASYTANQLKESIKGRNATMMNTIANYSPMGLKSTAKYNITLTSNIKGALLLINGMRIPTGEFCGLAFANTTISAVAPAGYTFKGWRNMNSSYESYFTTNEAFALNADNLCLKAVFDPMTDEERTLAGIHPVCINEISASNDIFVNDYFKKADWVELYNTTDYDIDLEGMYISDDAAKPYKSKITKGDTQTNTIIPAHGHMIVWCDKQNAKSQLHASFKISGDGGTIYLSAADKTWTDSLSYPAHDEFSSVGRYPDGASKVFVMHRPTIATTNIATSYMQEYDPVATGMDGCRHDGTDMVTIQVQLGRLAISGNGMISVEIYSVSGQRVGMAIVDGTGKGYISTSHLQQGCYIAKATDGSGNQSVCKFSISHNLR
ncbi:MAG: CotH kinase family protein [Prevotella sp.]|nr:CotH kinase family protein [Prevotella sp.]